MARGDPEELEEGAVDKGRRRPDEAAAQPRRPYQQPQPYHRSPKQVIPSIDVCDDR